MNILAKCDRKLKGLAFMGAGYFLFASYYAYSNCMMVAAPSVSNDNIAMSDSVIDIVEPSITSEALCNVENIGPAVVSNKKIAAVNDNQQVCHLKRVKFQGQDVTYAEGIINSNFYESAAAINIPYNIVHSFISILKPRINFRSDLQKGDKFAVVYSDSGEIVYLNVKTRKRDLSAYKNPNGKKGYYLQNGSPIDGHLCTFKKPINGARVSSPYGVRRHPILKVSRKHDGIDYAAAYGTPVHAVSGGTVKVKAYNPLSGNHVIIKHAGGYESLYAHLSSFAKISVGQNVSCGDIIGKVGSTGMSTGAHLHFGMKKNGAYIDPNSRIVVEKQKLCGAGYDKFKRYIGEIDKMVLAASKKGEESSM